MKKRILHVIPTLMSGGAERQIASLITHTSADKFAHLVCTFRESDFFAPTIRAAGHEVIEMGVTGKHPFLSGTLKLLSVIRRFQPDIINTWLYDANIVGRLAKLRYPGIPLITTLHSPDYEPNTIRSGDWSPAKVEGLRRIDWATARLTKPYFVAVSQDVKRSYQKRLQIADSQITVIYNGVEPELLKSTEGESQRLREECNIPTDGFIYLTVGRLDLQKNLPLLLRVFPQVLKDVSQAYLIIVGVGALEQELKNLADSLGIKERVRFLGRRSDIGTCLEMADVFVFPTLLEGFGIALVEAMFKKLACIASDIEVLHEIVTHGETALLFNPSKPNDLIAAMKKMAHDPDLRRKLGDQAFEKAEKQFNIRNTALEWEDFYQFVLSKTRPA